MENKIIQILEGAVGNQLTKGINELGNEANLFDNGLDSIGFINIIIALENEFDIFIDQDDLELDTFSSIKSIQEYIEARIEEK